MFPTRPATTANLRLALVSPNGSPDSEQRIVCTVCIANFNGIEFLDDCLSSVLNQSVGFGVEVIVHDDCSSDGSADYLTASYPQVRVIESRVNVGFCKANNRMVAAAAGEYVLLLNNDACLHPGALQAFYDSRGTAEEQLVLSLPQFEAGTSTLIDYGYDPDPRLYAIPNFDRGRTSVGCVHGACFWISRELWNQFGGFPAWFEGMTEDLLLCSTVRLAGGDVRIIAHSGYDHWVGQSYGGGLIVERKIGTTRKRRSLSERNRVFVMIATYPAPILQLVLPIHLLLLLCEGILLSLISRDSRIWVDIYRRCFVDLWLQRSNAKQLRSFVQAQRTIGRWSFFSKFRPYPAKLTALVRYGLPQIE